MEKSAFSGNDRSGEDNLRGTGIENIISPFIVGKVSE